ncbi:MAG: hypothetical protein JNL41_14080 [Phenylobacterium sp.]|uniref:hypothetical protein n=1 Tax=Phenylobacterium sp. TaxID=1871053 RepID=UPI001A396720|nr:hypothetical protein [Phenylobacterium sp.]MBL8555398.1 hypothetical protein [Phenylobacterium sp.]
MRTKHLCAGATALLALAPIPAVAQTTAQRIAALETATAALQQTLSQAQVQIAGQEAQITELRGRLDASVAAQNRLIASGATVRIYYDPTRNLCLFARDDVNNGNGAFVVTGDCGNNRARFQLIRP